MTRRESELDRITTLLGQCLGRIDEQAYRLQRQAEEDGEDYEACDALEREAGLLQELIASAIAQAGRSEQADLDRVVEHALRGAVAELGVPIVVRQRLAGGLPPVACTPGQLAYAVQRALMLALGAAEAGDEIVVLTRRDRDVLLFEIDAPLHGEPHLGERAATLAEFVAGLGGSCRIDADGRSVCLIAMELPTALVADS